jgi:hypothetical protein
VKVIVHVVPAEQSGVGFDSNAALAIGAVTTCPASNKNGAASK